jgi:hypothetical protein
MSNYNIFIHPYTRQTLPTLSTQAQHLLYQLNQNLLNGGGSDERSKDIYTLRSKMKRRHRGERVKGWGKWKPKTRGDRRDMVKDCGPQCFLYPDAPSYPKFPICSRNNNGDCFLDCKGVQAAYIRARQWRKRFPQYNKLAEQAKVLKKNLCER